MTPTKFPLLFPGLLIALAAMVSLYPALAVSPAGAGTTGPGPVNIVLPGGSPDTAGPAADAVSFQGVRVYGEVMYPYALPSRVVPRPVGRGYPVGPAYTPSYYYPAGYTPVYTNYPTGTVTVTSDPSAAIVTIDGGTTETTPWIYTNLFAGYHTIEINYPGYEAYTTSIYVGDGSNPEVDAELVPLQTYGSLTVDTTPEGADVFIDSNDEGLSPVTVGGLTAGTHQVEAHLAGYTAQVQMVTVASGQGTDINIPMAAYSPSSDEGSIAISANVPGALVYLDGTYKGAITDGNPFNVVAVSPGSHALLLHNPGYTDFTQTTVVTAGQVTYVTATLTAAAPALQGTPASSQTGSLVATSSPSGGQVYLDNQFRGVAPVTVYDVAPGDHIVNMKLAGYSDWSGSVTVQPGQVAQVTAQFTGSPGAAPTTRAGLPAGVAVAALAAAAVAAAGRFRRRD
ncbi:MAG TPA: PEGA domain-containing protein [Methanoregula sp.]|nr:PEGA domain-containing protein [Methanoregula sp.]